MLKMWAQNGRAWTGSTSSSSNGKAPYIYDSVAFPRKGRFERKASSSVFVKKTEHHSYSVLQGQPGRCGGIISSDSVYCYSHRGGLEKLCFILFLFTSSNESLFPRYLVVDERLQEKIKEIVEPILEDLDLPNPVTGIELGTWFIICVCTVCVGVQCVCTVCVHCVCWSVGQY